MKLIKHNAVTGNDKLIHDASLTRKLSEIDSNALKNLLTSEYLKFNLKSGREPKKEDEAMFEITLFRDEVLEYRWMTEDHLKIIFAKALKGEFGDEIIYFSIANFHKWAKKYYQEIQRVEMIVIESIRKEETNPIPTDEELKQMAIKGINDYCDLVLKAREKGKEYVFPFGGLHHLYDVASKFGIINLTKEEKLKLINEINPKLDDETKKQMAKGQAYRQFIYDLVDFGGRIDSSGKVISL